MTKQLYALGERPPLGEVPEKMHAWLVRADRFGKPTEAFQKEVVNTPSIADDEVLVDGEHIGHLAGFRFRVDPQARLADRKLLLAAAERHLPALLAERANRLTEALEAGGGEIRLEGTALCWHAEPVARLVAVGLMATLDYTRADASSKSAPAARRPTAAEVGIATLAGVLPLLLLNPREALAVLAVSAVVGIQARRVFLRRLGGYTGDCLGAAQQVAELAIYLGILAAWSFT